MLIALRTSRLQLLWLIAAVFAPLLAAAGWIGWKQYEAQREALGQTLVGAAHALATAADRELGTGLTLVQTLAHSPLLDQKRFDLFHALATKAATGHRGAWVVLFSPEGDQLINTVRPYGTALPNAFALEKKLVPAGPGEPPRGGARDVHRCFETKQPVYGDLFQGQVSGSFLVGVTVPVMRGGAAAYCLTVALPATTFQSLLQQPGIPAAGAVIFDRQGFIVARAVRPAEFVGKLVPPETLEAFRTSSQSYARATNIEGARFFRAVVRSPVSGWGAGISVSEDVAFGAIWRSMRDGAAAVVLIVAFAMLAALRMGRLQAQRLEAEASSRAKDDFIAALSHELRNPLSAIMLSTEVMKRQIEPGHRARDALERIVRQSVQLRRLLDDLLDTSRAIHGKLKLDLRPVALRQTAELIVAEHLRRPGNAVNIEIEGPETWVKADPARLHQMVDNLIENAVKYGALSIRVRVGMRDQAFVEVVDDGDGIAPELMRRLFEPFVQGEQSLERSRGGLGLGLAMVKRLAELHGGSVTASSSGSGGGSTFTLLLPASAPPARLVESTEAVDAGLRRFVVVDDQDDARESLRALLAGGGHEVHVAADGLEGLARIEALRPDVALVDIGLPGIDGYEIARRVRLLPGGADMTLIAVTGYGQMADRERAMASGFDAHLTKPFSYSELINAIEPVQRRSAA